MGTRHEDVIMPDVGIIDHGSEDWTKARRIHVTIFPLAEGYGPHHVAVLAELTADGD